MYKGDRVMNTLQDLIKNMPPNIKNKLWNGADIFIAIQSYLGEEKNTSLFIQKVLGELGIPFVNDVSDYAVIGKIEGAHTGPVIALRADMDALPIHEITGLPFASQMKALCMLVVMIATWQSCLVQQRFYSLLKINCTAL